ncbi:hypothetical protein JXB41_05220 [Candidatus Woesearchaeota archaeon]|nr:hypothetical protein [Candidatus Woesearchaeota archaeon]
MKIIKTKKAFLPALLATEVHYFFIGLVIGIVLLIVLLLLGRSGTIPISLCKLLCGC